jgi:uncharacterized protein YdaU (DUF1376 family)
MGSSYPIEKRTHPSCRSFFSGWILGRGKMHYYQHHIGDFIKDTSFLTNEEVGIYLKLLWLYYDTEQPLPNSIFELSMKVNARDQQETLQGILEMFFSMENNMWHHKRCDKEISFYKQQLETASKAGKASAAKRALNRNSTGVERALDSGSTVVQPTNNQQPITNNHKPNIRATVVAMPDGISQSVWDEFVKHRKSKKAQVTQLVIDGIQKEAEKAGFTLEDALKEIVLRNWQSFKADWVVQKQNTFNKVDIARVTVPSSSQRDPALVKLDEDRLKTAPPNPEVLAKIRAVLGKTA